MAITLGSAVTINSISYEVSGNGIATIAGNIDVTAALHPTAVVSGLPVGDGYAVALDAMSTDGKTACHGAGTFSIASGQTAMVNVALLCRGAGAGTVMLGARLDNCPFISSVSTTATELPVGGTAMISASATDYDPDDTIYYTWRLNPAAVGIFGNPSLASTTFKCSAAATARIDVTVSDAACGETRTGALVIVCKPPVVVRDAGAGATGAGGAGGSGGAAGQGAGGLSGSGGTRDASSDSPPSYSCPGLEPGTTTSACGTCSGTCSLGPGGTDGCCNLSAASEQALCAAVVECFTAHAAECTASGDGTNCFCGSSSSACFMTAGAANGVCAAEVIAAARTSDPAAIMSQFVSAQSPLGHAVNLVSCRGAFCPAECGLPP